MVVFGANHASTRHAPPTQVTSTSLLHHTVEICLVAALSAGTTDPFSAFTSVSTLGASSCGTVVATSSIFSAVPTAAATAAVASADVVAVAATLPFECGWSLLNHGVAKRRRCDLGNLNPV